MNTQNLASEGQPSISSIVFDGKGRNSTRILSIHWGLPIFIACLLHCLLWWIASSTGLSLETWSARMATSIHQELVAQAPVAVETALFKVPAPQPEVQVAPLMEAKPPPPPPSREVKRRGTSSVQTKKSKRAMRSTTRASTSSAPKPAQSEPAQAGKVIAAESQERVDLTDNVFIQGTGSAYVGGVTTAQGRGMTARSSLKSKGRRVEPKRRANSKARSVRLSAKDWKCAWPQEAVDQRIYQQTVVIKVIVNPEGRVDQAIVLDDPGFGFGEAAKRCALVTAFSPAVNREGEAIRALSPPIKVRFTR